MTHRLLRAIALGCVLAIVLIATAFAQSPGDIVNAVCSDQGKTALVSVLSLICIGTVITWAKTRLAAAPAWVQALVHFCALNWPTVLRVLRSGAAALLLAIILAGCASDGSPIVPLPVPLAPTGIDWQLTFKNACAGASTANGSFQAMAPSLLLAGKVSQAEVDQEKATFVLVSNRCDNPPVTIDASGKAVVDYQALALDTASDAAAIWLLYSGAVPAK